MWLRRFSMRCKRCASWAASRVSMSFNICGQNVESSGFNFWHPFNCNPWQWGPAPSLSAVTFFVNCNSGATICHGVPHKPSQFVNSQASLSVCLVQLLPRTTLFLVIHKTAPVRIMMTNEDSSSHATCKRADTIFSNFAKPNFLSKLRHWVSPPSTSSPHFTRLAVFANSHFIHDLRCIMDCHLRYVHSCFVQLKFEEFRTVFSLLSWPSPHDHWLCDDPQVVLAGITSTPAHA